MKNVMNLVLVLSFVLGTAINVSASCYQTIASKSGKVYSAGPGILKVTPTMDEIDVILKKTAGKAETQANIYVDGVFKKKMEFDNGKYTKTKERTLTGVKNKLVKIEIVNQSFANTFSYTLTVKGDDSAKKLVSEVHNLFIGQAEKRVDHDKKACKNSVKVTVKRISGAARASIFVYRNGIQIDNDLLDKNETKYERTFTNSGLNSYEVKVKNNSIGNNIKFRAKIIQEN